MARKVSLFTGQWADLPFETMCRKAREFGFDGLELAVWGDHFNADDALNDKNYCANKRAIMREFHLEPVAISSHLVGQAVCDPIDARHKMILPAHVWGDGNPEGVRSRAAEEMKKTAWAAKEFGMKTVVGFTGSPIWHLLYAFPPVSKEMIDEGFRDFGRRWRPILDEFKKAGVRFALEVHPTEIAFDHVTAARALEAVDYHESFGFNFDPSHLGYQGVDYVSFIREFKDRIFHVHVKDAAWAKSPTRSGVFGGHLAWGDSDRRWDFRSPGRGDTDFESIIRALNEIGYDGPLSVEWEDSGMDREHGAKEACEFVRRLDFKSPPRGKAFDAAFEK